MKPFNRFLLIQPLAQAQSEQESFVLVPESYKPASPYVSVKVLDFADDCKLNLKKDQTIVVDNSMVQEVEINKETKFLILENYVMGALD